MSRRGLFLLSVLGACAPEVASDPTAAPSSVAGEAADGVSWSREGDALVGGSRDLSGRFAEGEVALELAGDVISLRPARVGRDGVGDALAGAPQLGPCVGPAVDGAPECARRLEYVGSEASEWWSARADGLQQGWQVDVAPGGAGELTLDVSVDDAFLTVDPEGRQVLLRSMHGGVVYVDRLAAVDADGVTLPAWFEPSADGFRVRVDDATATYPVFVDPVYTTAAWSAAGRAAGTLYPTAVAHADVNGDGFSDLVHGATDATASRIFVYFGAAQGIRTVPDQVISGAVGSEFGYSVAFAGDVNDDGFDDVVVGAPGTGTASGNAYVYFGSATGLSTNTSLSGGTASSLFGYAVAGVGDTNGDGYPDVAVGAPGASAGRGAYLVFAGTSVGVSSTAYFTGAGEAGAYAGVSLSGTTDMNADGRADLIVGGPAQSMRGCVYVHLSTTTGITSTRTKLSGTVDRQAFGGSVAGVGDVTGDGRGDFLVGVPFASEDGFVRLYRGTSSGVSTVATYQGGTRESMGEVVAGIGDVNDDGIPDVAWSAPVADPPRVEVRYGTGTTTGLPTTPSLTLTAPALVSTGSFGARVSAAGDVNGDGADDLIAGSGGSQGGLPFVYYGATTGLNAA